MTDDRKSTGMYFAVWLPRRSGLNQALIAGKSGTKRSRLIVRRQQLPAIAVEAVQSELCILLLAKGCGKNLEILLTHSGLLGISDIALVSISIGLQYPVISLVSWQVGRHKNAWEEQRMQRAMACTRGAAGGCQLDAVVTEFCGVTIRVLSLNIQGLPSCYMVQEWLLGSWSYN